MWNSITSKFETALKLKEIDLYSSSSAKHLVANEIDIGSVALTHIQELSRRDKVSKTCVLAQKMCKKVCDGYYWKIIGEKPNRLCYS